MSAAADKEAADKEAADKKAADKEAAGIDVTEDEQPGPDGDADADVDADAEPAAAAPPVKKKTVSKWFSRNKRSAAAAAVAAFVIAGGLAGAAVQPYLMERAAVTTKLTIARTAAAAITALWSYTPEDMDSLPNRSAKYLGGELEGQYRQYVDAIAPTNKQAKVTSATQVVGVGVESLRGDDATAIVYTNTTSTTPQSNNIPSMKYLSYRLVMHRYGSDWRVTKMTTVTSLDLTPKLGM